ncbi:GAF and ANTAR domain-containing protein [Nakamurella deserti]|uniref:GAF and ANTAR domain-containing protein n=1 Tax=Nakamurella deserti TaxID=2164074 RepID=UPI0014783368|nr:GAF and ANTAR domain-containing protein [Nakamurella deserti]
MHSHETTAWMEALSAAVVDADGDVDPYGAVLEAVVSALPEVDGAVLCVVKAGKPVTVAVHGDVADPFTEAQRHLGQGPTVQTFEQRTTITSADLTTDIRWPKLGQMVVALPVRSVVCFPMGDPERPVTLTLYAAQPSALDHLDADLLRLVLAHTGIALAALAQRTRAQNLQRAIRTNEPISVATGILMTLHGCTEADAMAVMTAASRAQNRKLSDIAAEVVLTGAMPPPPTGS